MKQSVLVLGNSDSGLYDFRKEVLMALMQEGYEVHVSVPDTGYLEKIKKGKSSKRKTSKCLLCKSWSESKIY